MVEHALQQRWRAAFVAGAGGEAAHAAQVQDVTDTQETEWMGWGANALAATEQSFANACPQTHGTVPGEAWDGVLGPDQAVTVEPRPVANGTPLYLG